MRRRGASLMFGGLLCFAAALCLCGWNLWEDSRAWASVDRILPRVEEHIEAEAGGGEPTLEPVPTSSEMTEVEIDGYRYIGYLSIPNLEIELPVMSDWSYPQLKIAPCRYYGSTKTENLVIAAHNYSQHFGGIDALKQGDAVYFTDMDGCVSSYQVLEVIILDPDAVEQMVHSGYALTLFTCTYGGGSRVTVRCNAVD